MKRVLTGMVIFFSLTVYAQRGMWKPFKLLVIQPDTAMVAKSLYSDRDSIEADHLKSYYSALQRMEALLNFQDYSKETEQSFKETQERLKKEIPEMKSYEGQVKKFKYYQTISQYSAQVYSFYFNEYEPFSTIVELPKHKTDLQNLKTLADSVNADYIVFYSNIHSVNKDGGLILRLTTSLYSKKDGRIILAKETEGDTISRGDMWTCNQQVPLSCLLINGVRTSTDEIAAILRRRQIRNK